MMIGCLLTDRCTCEFIAVNFSFGRVEGHAIRYILKACCVSNCLPEMKFLSVSLFLQQCLTDSIVTHTCNCKSLWKWASVVPLLGENKRQNATMIVLIKQCILHPVCDLHLESNQVPSRTSQLPRYWGFLVDFFYSARCLFPKLS